MALVYQATVTNNNSAAMETYIGLTKNNFKSRYNNHTASSRNHNKTLYRAQEILYLEVERS